MSTTTVERPRSAGLGSGSGGIGWLIRGRTTVTTPSSTSPARRRWPASSPASASTAGTRSPTRSTTAARPASDLVLEPAELYWSSSLPAVLPRPRWRARAPAATTRLRPGPRPGHSPPRAGGGRAARRCFDLLITQLVALEARLMQRAGPSTRPAASAPASVSTAVGDAGVDIALGVLHQAFAAEPVEHAGDPAGESSTWLARSIRRRLCSGARASSSSTSNSLIVSPCAVPSSVLSSWRIQRVRVEQARPSACGGS